MRQVLGAILMAVGVLIAGTLGLCAMLFLGLGALGSGGLTGAGGFVAALAGGFLLGAALFGAGLYIQRSDPAHRD